MKYRTWPRIPRGKVTKTQENIEYKSQKVSPFPAGDHKAASNKQDNMTDKHRTDVDSYKHCCLFSDPVICLYIIVLLEHALYFRNKYCLN